MINNKAYIKTLTDLENSLTEPPPYCLKEKWKDDVLAWLISCESKGFLLLCKEEVINNNNAVLEKWNSMGLEDYRRLFGTDTSNYVLSIFKICIACAQAALHLKNMKADACNSFSDALCLGDLLDDSNGLKSLIQDTCEQIQKTTADLPERMTTLCRLVICRLKNSVHDTIDLQKLINKIGFTRNLIADLSDTGEQQPIQRKEFPVLLIKKEKAGNEYGIIAHLKLEVMGNGTHSIYPSSEMAFIKRDTAFQSAEQNAWLYVKKEFGEEYDIRWTLSGDPDISIGHHLYGGSLGGAFALGMKDLAGNAMVLPPGATISAGITPGGELLKIDGLSYKLNATVHSHMLPVNSVVIAEKQDIKTGDLQNEMHCNTILKSRNKDFYIIKAKNVSDAVSTLAILETRWHMCHCSSLFKDYFIKDYQGRDTLFSGIHHFVTTRKKGCLLLVGGMGKGKSTFLAQLIYRSYLKGERPVYHFIGSHPSFTPNDILQCITNKLKQKYIIPGFPGNVKNLNIMDGKKELENYLIHIGQRMSSTGKIEIIYIDAIDQLWLADRHISSGYSEMHDLQFSFSGILHNLPPGIFFILTSRINPYIFTPSGDMTIWNMDDYTDDRKDIRDYLMKKKADESLPVSGKVIEGIVTNKQAPVFFSITRCVEELKKNPANELLKTTTTPWTSPAEDLVEKEIQTILLACQKKNISAIDVLKTLGIHVAAFEPLNEVQLREFGLWQEGTTDTILTLSSSLFKVFSYYSPENPYRFEHPGFYQQLVRHMETILPECHRILARCCSDCWKTPETPGGKYALTYRIPHLAKGEMWKQVIACFADVLYLFTYCQYADFIQLYNELSSFLKNIRLPQGYKTILQEYEQFLKPRLDFLKNHPRAYLHEVCNEFLPYKDGNIRKAFLSVKNYISNSASILFIKKAGPPALQVQGHSGSITAIAFSPDGKKLVSGGSDGTINIWEVSSGRLITYCKEQPAAIKAIALSPENNFFVSGSDDGAVAVWDLESGQLIAGYKEHRRSITALVFSSYKKIFATASDDCTIKIWEYGNKESIATCKGHAKAINSIAFSPDGRLIVSGSDDTTMKIWEMQTGNLITTLQAHTQAVSTVAYSPQGRFIASGGWDGAVRLWDAQTGKCVAECLRHTGIITIVRFSPDGLYVISGSWDAGIKVWEVPGGKMKAEMFGHTGIITSLSVSPDGKYIVTGSEDTTIKVWELSTGILTSACKEHTDRISQVICQDTIIASTGDDGTIKIWNPEIDKLIADCKNSFITEKALTVSHSHMASVLGDTCIRILDMSTGRKVLDFTHHWSSVNCAAFSKTTRDIATGSWDRTIKIWDSQTGIVKTNCKGEAGIITCLDFSMDGTVLAGYEKGHIVMWDPETGVRLGNYNEHTSKITALTTSHCNNIVSSADDTGIIKIWDIPFGKSVISCPGHTKAVTTLVFSPDNHYLASGGKDRKLKVWDTRNGRLISEYTGHSLPVNTCSISPDNRFIASGSDDRTVMIWDITGFTCVYILFFSSGIHIVRFTEETSPTILIIDKQGRIFKYLINFLSDDDKNRISDIL
ncbi:MAG: PD40 domain-containing protein [Spirochaetales bacterium]|nr:PD40 domain-containing protein [Spirochaetales bacterium]